MQIFTKKLLLQMKENNESYITIPDENKEIPHKEKVTTMLSKSIEGGDLSYIKEVLSSKYCYQEIEKITYSQKKKMLILLLDVLDHPLRLEAINAIYFILNNVGDSGDMCKALIERSTDFSKLVCLKGKIDYLKYQAKNVAKNVKPKAEYNEKDF